MFHLDALKNKLLVASPFLQNSCFQQSIVFLYEHGSKGTIGFIMNKPSPVQLGEALKQAGIVSHTFSYPPHHPVLRGGSYHPDEIFLMYSETKENVFNFVLLTPKEALLHFANDTIPPNVLFFSGYSAWAAGQLERELKENLWMFSDLNEEIFQLPYEQRWKKTAKMNGIDFNHLFIDQVGHA